MKKLLQVLAVSTLLASSLLFGTARAAGAGSLSLSPSGGSYVVSSNFTVSVLVNGNGSPVNVVTMKVSYDPSKLEVVGTPSCGGAFGGYAGAAGGPGGFTLGCYVTPGAPVPTGSATVGSITFNALATGTTSVNFAAGSQVASAGADIWNGSTAGGSYNIVAAAPAGGSGSGSTGSTSSSGSTSKTSSTTKKAATVAVGSTTGSSNTPAGAAAATVTTDSNGNVKAASVTTIKKTEAAETAVPTQSNTAAWILAGLLIVGLAILAFLRREQLGAFVASTRNKFASKPSAKAAKPAATTVASKTTAQRISKK